MANASKVNDVARAVAVIVQLGDSGVSTSRGDEGAMISAQMSLITEEAARGCSVAQALLDLLSQEAT